MEEILNILLPYNYVPIDLLTDITRFFKTNYTSSKFIQLDSSYSNCKYYKTFLCLRNTWIYIGEMECNLNTIIHKEGIR